MTEAGSVVGTLSYNWREGDRYDVEFTAFDADLWETGVIRKLTMRFTVLNMRPAALATPQEADERRAEATARRSVEEAFGYYDAWTKQRLSHEQTVARMKGALGELRRVLGEHTHLAAGEYWMYLGG